MSKAAHVSIVLRQATRADVVAYDGTNHEGVQLL
jgi:hypothetical protein